VEQGAAASSPTDRDNDLYRKVQTEPDHVDSQTAPPASKSPTFAHQQYSILRTEYRETAYCRSLESASVVYAVGIRNCHLDFVFKMSQV